MLCYAIQLCIALVFHNWGERERAHPCGSKARFFYIRSRVIPQSSFYASFLISTHAHGEFEIDLDALRSHSNRGTHVFNNCGAVNSRGLLLSRQKRERPVFNNGGSVNSRGLLHQKRERPVFSKCGSVGSRGLLKGLQTREKPVFTGCGSIQKRQKQNAHMTGRITCLWIQLKCHYFISHILFFQRWFRSTLA